MTEAEDHPAKERTEKAGAAFERLAAAVQAKLAPGARVAWNERINGRQIDGTVRGRLGSTEMLVIIECRDYAKKLGQRHVDALNTVRKLVGRTRRFWWPRRASPSLRSRKPLS